MLKFAQKLVINEQSVARHPDVDLLPMVDQKTVQVLDVQTEVFEETVNEVGNKIVTQVSVCLTCSGPLTVESGNGWLHKFCPVRVGHHDYWEGLGNWAREQGMKTGLELVNEAIARAECPECHEPLSCSDSTDAMGCWFCSLVVVGGQIQ